MFHNFLKIPKSECQDIWIRLPRHKWPKSWSSMEDPVVPLERESVWSSFGRTIFGKGIWENYVEIRLGESFQIGNAFSYTVKKDYSYLCMWMTSNWLERNKILIRCGNYQTKKLIWQNQHLSLIMSTWECAQRQCEISKDIIDNYRTMFESRISAEATEKLSCSENLSISSWSYDMEGHAKKCVERYCELANKTTQQLYKVSTPWMYAHHFKDEELKSVGNLSQALVSNCSEMIDTWQVLFTDHRIFCGQWTIRAKYQAFQNNLRAQLLTILPRISILLLWSDGHQGHHTSEYKQYCHVGNTAKQCRLGLFQDSDFAGELEDSKSTSGGTLFSFGSQTFVPISWMCKKQTSISHSSTESEIISLDAGFRIDGFPSLDFWDLIVTVLHLNTNQSKLVQEKPVYISNAKENSWKDWSE